MQKKRVASQAQLQEQKMVQKTLQKISNPNPDDKKQNKSQDQDTKADPADFLNKMVNSQNSSSQNQNLKKKRDEKGHQKQSTELEVLAIAASKHSQTLQFDSDDQENTNNYQDFTQLKTQITEKLINSKNPVSNEQMKAFQCKTEHFPKIQVTASQIPNKFASKFVLHKELLRATSIHEQTLAKLGLLNQESSKNSFANAQNLEFFSMLRSGFDVTCGQYKNYDDLKYKRLAYIVHILDIVLQNRHQCILNSQAIQTEENEENDNKKIHVGNVFKLAKQAKEQDKKNKEKERDNESSSSDEDEDAENSDEDHDETQHKNDLGDQEFLQTDKIKIQKLEAKEDRRDQGFTRAKILILCPFKQVAFQIIEQIVYLANQGKWKKTSKKKKFREEYASEEEAFNDFFRIGLSVNYNKKNSDQMHLKLYEHFYESDIIVASPLAIRLLCGDKIDDKGKELNAEGTAKVDRDFLSSIEHVILDQAEAFQFQNMEHVEEVLKNLNHRPKKLSQLNEISRISEIFTLQPPKQQNQKYLSMITPYYRQLISISKFMTDDLDLALAQSRFNLSGHIQIVGLHENRAKQLAQDLNLQVTLKRLPELKSIEKVDESRFSLFTKQLWKSLYEQACEPENGYTVLFVPSYFDYVKLKNFFKIRNFQKVGMISEYTEKRQAQRTRTMYEQKELAVLMITERTMVFQKLRLRYCRNLVMYSLPESPDIIDLFPDFMDHQSQWPKIQSQRLRELKASMSAKNSEMTEEELIQKCKAVVAEGRRVQSSGLQSIVGLFSQYDALVLERMVGTANYKKYLNSQAQDAFTITP